MKPQKLVNNVSEDEQVGYTAADYATVYSCGALGREGKQGAVKAILDAHGASMGDSSTMDPMEILILLEEHEAGE